MLYEPLNIGNTKTETRLVLPPMASRSAENGLAGEAFFQHYRPYAENPGVGVLITEHSYIDVQGKADPKQTAFDSDRVISQQKMFTARMHEIHPGLLLIAQISHAGAATDPDVTGQELVSASPVTMRQTAARGLTVEEIHTISRKFAEAAVRVKNAGYDGVEIHSAHGYLLNQFYSPLTNHRTDEYGPQSIENRLRFLEETLRLVRKTVGPDFPVFVRLGGADYQTGGSTAADAAEAARRLEADGADLIDVSGGMCMFQRPGHPEAGYFRDQSELIRQSVRIPVLLTGGVKQPEEAEQLLQDGKADLIGVGRAMLRDPQWGERINLHLILPGSDSGSIKFQTKYLQLAK